MNSSLIDFKYYTKPVQIVDYGHIGCEEFPHHEVNKSIPSPVMFHPEESEDHHVPPLSPF